ncbi:SLIK3 protein, partial [Amia calva]|nr:SLIK3 protein [Amia calva]
MFSKSKTLRILDLSACSITEIYDVSGPVGLLQELYLDHNKLKKLPENFLANTPNLRVLHLQDNKLQKLPGNFLQESHHLEELHLDFNHLSSLPLSIFKPGLQRLELSNNSLDCTCDLIELLQESNKPQRVNASDWRWLITNLTCASPEHLYGKSVWSIKKTEVCRSKGLTALFILLPLTLVLALVLCWCCGRKRKRKEGTFDLAKRASHLSTVDRNGSDGMMDRRHHYKPCEVALPRDREKNILLKNQLMFRPSTALLGSNRDLYEEVEIKLGSVDSLVQPPPDLETVSVTEVLKDSNDREKLYLTQSTEYYNLVPGIDLGDSDHGEYENVDLS